MIQCIKCGNEMPVESVFCNKCGNNIELTGSTSKNKSKKRIFVMVGLPLVLAILIGAGWYYYDYSQQQVAIAIEEKIKSDAMAAENAYTDQMKQITSSITNDHINKFSSPLNDADTLYIMLNNLEAVDKTLKAITSLASDANAKIISLQDVKAPSEYETQHNNFIDALNKYKDTVEAKKAFMDTNKVEIVAYNKLFMEGNIFSVQKTVDLSGEYEKLTNEIKSSINNLKQRTENLNSKF